MHEHNTEGSFDILDYSDPAQRQYIAPTAPQFVPQQFVPPTAHKTPKKHWGLIAVVAGLVLAMVALAGYGFHEHQSLTASQAHGVEVSSQLTHAQKNLKSTQAELVTTKSQRDDAQFTAKVCNWAVNAAKHSDRALGHTIDALDDDMFTQISDLNLGLNELNQANRIAKDHGYSGVDGLYSACIGTGGSNA